MKKARSKKGTVLFLVSITILLLVVLLFVNDRTAKKSSFLMEGRQKLVVAGEVSAVSNNSSFTYCVRDLLLEAQGENLRVKNIKGSVAWSQKLPGKIVRMSDTGENIVIVDSLNNIHYYSLQGKLLWTYKAQYEIIDVFTEENGSILLEYKGITGSHAEAFTQKGSKIGSISIENAHVLSFSTGTSSFSISVIDTSAEAIKTKIITYNFKGDILWAQNFDNNIISKLNYNKNDKLLALGENTMYIYKNDGRLQGEVNIDGKLTNVAMSDYITVACLENKGKLYSVSYDANMHEQSRIEIRETPMGIFPMKNNFIIYYNDELMVLTMKGELLARHKSNTDISKVYMTLDNKVYIVSSRRLQLLEYSK